METHSLISTALHRITLLLLVVYTAVITATLGVMVLDLPYNPHFTTSLTMLAFLFAVLHGGQRLGWQQAALLLGLTFGISLLFESVGVATGWVYGAYHYTDRLGIKFLGLVPYLIPLAWFMMSYPSYLIAERIMPAMQQAWFRRLGVAALGAFIMTAWDVAMDPVMVAGGHWVWEVEGAYFGIPLQNFWGWWLTSFVAFAIFAFTTRRDREIKSWQPGFDRLAVASYAVTAASTVLAGWQAGLNGPALAGIFSMAPWILIGWWKAGD